MNTENGDSLSGLTTEIPFSIVQGEVPHGDVTPGNGLELTDDLINFLRRRDTTYRNEMADLGADASLARTVSFQKTEAFLNAPSDSDDFEEKYFDLVNTLERAAIRTDSGGERQGEFFKLMEVATKHFMDREIVKSPDNISKEILSNLTEKIARLEEIGFNRETLTSNWAAESLKNQLNAPVTESFEKAITKR